jgi:hypothetical protein
VKKISCLSLLLACGAGAGAAGLFAGSASAVVETVCASEQYEWGGERLLVPWEPTFETGDVIPGAAAGEQLVLTGISYTAFDRYPDEAEPSRAGADQQHESFGIAIGGVEVGGLSADLPDSVDEGAESDWFSGMRSGSLGGAGTVSSGGSVHRSSVTVKPVARTEFGLSVKP